MEAFAQGLVYKPRVGAGCRNRFKLQAKIAFQHGLPQVCFSCSSSPVLQRISEVARHQDRLQSHVALNPTIFAGSTSQDRTLQTEDTLQMDCASR
jgi:hypothetical protein